MKILITGAAGFIGFHLSRNLLKFKKNKIYGIDNFDKYYSIKLKKKRIELLKKEKNFHFQKIDITSTKLSNFLKNKNFDIIIHLAAQAGVRYSMENPEKYLNTNILGFSNLLENLNRDSLKKILYASSSSVYGDTTNFPTNEKNKTNPKNIYGYSKIINEVMSKYYSRKLNVPFVGLRFFTIYGIWGRPDMFILKLLNSHIKRKTFYLNNNGNHLRDFTSINDVVEIIKKIIDKKNIKSDVYNVCSSNPISIKQVLKIINKNLGKIKTKNIKRHPADVLNTFGDNKKILKDYNFSKFSNFNYELIKIIDWFQKIKNKNYF
jgi:UDP-glucuronate 4-epimerase